MTRWPALAACIAAGALLAGCNALLEFQDDYEVGGADGGGDIASAMDASTNDSGADATSRGDAHDQATDSGANAPPEASLDGPAPQCTSDHDCIGKSCMEGVCVPPAACDTIDASSSNRLQACSSDKDCHGYTSTCVGPRAGQPAAGLPENYCMEVADCNASSGWFTRDCCGPGVCGTVGGIPGLYVSLIDSMFGLPPGANPFGNLCCVPGEPFSNLLPAPYNAFPLTCAPAGNYLCVRDSDCAGLWNLTVCIEPPDGGAHGPSDSGLDASDAAGPPSSYGTCMQCRDDGNCPSTVPRCIGNSCVQCTGDPDCPSTNRRCVSNTCKQCTSNADCSGGTPYCSANNSCVACTQAAQCPGAEPACNSGVCG